MDSIQTWLKPLPQQLLLYQCACPTVRHGFFLSSILFLVCRDVTSCHGCDWAHWRITMLYKDPRTFSKLVILPLHKKNCQMANWRLSTVTFLRLSQWKKSKNPNANSTATWISPRWPCSSRWMTLVTSLTSKAFLRLGGLTRIHRPASATCGTMGWSLNSWQLLFLWTQLEPYIAEFSSETELPCWIRCTKYRAKIKGFAGKAVALHWMVEFFHVWYAQTYVLTVLGALSWTKYLVEILQVATAVDG